MMRTADIYQPHKTLTSSIESIAEEYLEALDLNILIFWFV